MRKYCVTICVTLAVLSLRALDCVVRAAKASLFFVLHINSNNDYSILNAYESDSESHCSSLVISDSFYNPGKIAMFKALKNSLGTMIVCGCNAASFHVTDIDKNKFANRKGIWK